MAADPELLREIPFFHTLDADDRALVADAMAERRFAAGTVIFVEGDPGGTMFVVTEGTVKLTTRDDQGHELLLDLLEPGEFFGEVSLLDGGARSATAWAETPVHAFALPRETLLELLRSRSDVALDMITALGRRIRRADEALRRRVPNTNEVLDETSTLGERVADVVARFGGSWAFILSFSVLLVCWMLLNSVLPIEGRTPFDPYPFILLNLVLSTLAALQAPVIMMSQNRQDSRDRVRNELDYQVNVKAELEVLQVLDRVEGLSRQLHELSDSMGRRSGNAAGAAP